jgi:hypothetical protein
MLAARGDVLRRGPTQVHTGRGIRRTCAAELAPGVVSPGVEHGGRPGQGHAVFTSGADVRFGAREVDCDWRHRVGTGVRIHLTMAVLPPCPNASGS